MNLPKHMRLLADGQVESEVWLLAIAEYENGTGAEQHILERPGSGRSPWLALCGAAPEAGGWWAIPFVAVQLPWCEACKAQVQIIEREAMSTRLVRA